MLQQMDDYDPFGRSGGGAPLRDQDGRVLTDINPDKIGSFQRVQRSTGSTFDENIPDDQLGMISEQELQNTLANSRTQVQSSRKLEKPRVMRPDYLIQDTQPEMNAMGQPELHMPPPQKMPDLPTQGHDWPPKMPNFKEQPRNYNEIFVKPNLDYVTQELHPLYTQHQNFITDLHKERMFRDTEDNSRYTNMAKEELDQRVKREDLERGMRHEVEDMELEFNKIADKKAHDLKMMWQRRHDWEKKQWEDTQEQMKEREKYLATNDDIWLDKEIAFKLNAQILQAAKDMELQIKTAHNDVQKKISKAKKDTLQADNDYLDAMDEIDKLKEKL